MRALIVLAIAVLLYCIGEIYAIAALMVLAYALGIILILSFIVAEWSLAHLDVSIATEHAAMRRGDESPVEVTLSNRSRLPVALFRMKLSCSQPHDEARPSVLEVYGALSGRRRVQVPITPDAPHCTLLDIGMVRLGARDPLGLFSVHRSLTSSVHIAVLPRGGSPIGPAVEQGSGATPGDANKTHESAEPPDVQDVRAWQPGDALHRVHWKLSARIGELQTRLYVDNDEVAAIVLLDPADRGDHEQDEEHLPAPHRLTEVETDAWYEAVANTLEGLSTAGLAYEVLWTAPSEGGSDLDSWQTRMFTVRSLREVDTLLFELLDSEAVWAARVSSDEVREARGRTLTTALDHAGAQLPLILDGRPDLCQGSEILVIFDADGVPE